MSDEIFRKRKTILEIRKATLEDALAMTEILTRSWEAAYSGIIPDDAIREKNAGRLAMWQRVLAGEHNNYIALLEGAPAGLFSAMPCRDGDLSGAGEVGAIYLHPDHWGKGYGGEMLHYAVNTLGEQGHAAIVLWVLEENARSRRFYEKHGFLPDGARREIVYGRQITSMRYRLSLVANAEPQSSF